MSSIYEYYQILGISQQASINDIKQAYRQKAKQLHPDRNKNTNAHEEFILLNEAYEYLVNYKTGKTVTVKSKTYNTDWVDTERERAKAKAREYARMQYEEFINSPHYKSLTSLETVIDYLYLFFGIGLFIIIPVIITMTSGISGFIIAPLFFIITFPFIKYFFKHRLSAYSFSHFFSSLLHLIKTPVFLIGFVTIANLVLLFKIGLQTLISTNLLLSGIALIILLSYNFFKRRSKFKRYFYSFCLAPLSINLLLMINFIFSSNPVTETYFFTKTKDGSRESTLIYLDLDKYDEYSGIRLFMSYDEVRFNNTITYTFKKGLLGMRVMTDYSFSNEYRYGE